MQFSVLFFLGGGGGQGPFAVSVKKKFKLFLQPSLCSVLERIDIPLTLSRTLAFEVSETNLGVSTYIFEEGRLEVNPKICWHIF